MGLGCQGPAAPTGHAGRAGTVRSLATAAARSTHRPNPAQVIPTPTASPLLAGRGPQVITVPNGFPGPGFLFFLSLPLSPVRPNVALRSGTTVSKTLRGYAKEVRPPSVLNSNLPGRASPASPEIAHAAHTHTHTSTQPRQGLTNFVSRRKYFCPQSCHSEAGAGRATHTPLTPESGREKRRGSAEGGGTRPQHALRLVGLSAASALVLDANARALWPLLFLDRNPRL